MSGLTTPVLRAAIGRVRAKMLACQGELNALDGQLGDGDIGVTLVNGFESMNSAAAEFPEDLGMSLMQCAQALTRTGGSSYATLLATGFMAVAKESKGQTEIAWESISTLLQAALDKMAQRGKSVLGDKTVLDALHAAQLAANGKSDPALILAAIDEAVSAALDEFREKPCRQGRARIFAERSVGLDDPGMMAFKRMVEGLRDED